MSSPPVGAMSPRVSTSGPPKSSARRERVAGDQIGDPAGDVAGRHRLEQEIERQGGDREALDAPRSVAISSWNWVARKMV